ncbi:MAG: branched-chain amino acid ABC transporter permease [Chloroflexota bacterium]
MKSNSTLRLTLGIISIVFLLLYPPLMMGLASAELIRDANFYILQIGVQSLYLAILAMSLAFLAGYGGMVSLAQIALYGVGSYAFANLVSMNGYPAWVGILAALILPSIVAVLFALISVRTEGIYFLMITLALAMLTFSFALQNRSITRGFSGINDTQAPWFDPTNLVRSSTIFYYVAVVIALAFFFGFRYIVNTPFGLAMQAIRDNSRRMRALGFSVTAHRVAAFTLAGFVAGVAGLLGVWYNGQMSPGAIDLTRNINVLMIAVLGGLMYFEGAFVGAVFFVLVTTFASTFTNWLNALELPIKLGFNTLIGIAFLLVALFLKDGLMGLFWRLVDQDRGNALPASPATAAGSSELQALKPEE